MWCTIIRFFASVFASPSTSQKPAATVNIPGALIVSPTLTADTCIVSNDYVPNIENSYDVKGVGKLHVLDTPEDLAAYAVDMIRRMPIDPLCIYEEVHISNILLDALHEARRTAIYFPQMKHRDEVETLAVIRENLIAIYEIEPFDVVKKHSLLTAEKALLLDIALHRDVICDTQSLLLVNLAICPLNFEFPVPIILSGDARIDSDRVKRAREIMENCDNLEKSNLNSIRDINRVCTRLFTTCSTIEENQPNENVAANNPEDSDVWPNEHCEQYEEELRVQLATDAYFHEFAIDAHRFRFGRIAYNNERFRGFRRVSTVPRVSPMAVCFPWYGIQDVGLDDFSTSVAVDGDLIDVLVEQQSLEFGAYTLDVPKPKPTEIAIAKVAARFELSETHLLQILRSMFTTVQLHLFDFCAKMEHEENIGISSGHRYLLQAKRFNALIQQCKHLLSLLNDCNYTLYEHLAMSHMVADPIFNDPAEIWRLLLEPSAELDGQHINETLEFKSIINGHISQTAHFMGSIFPDIRRKFAQRRVADAFAPLARDFGLYFNSECPPFPLLTLECGGSHFPTDEATTRFTLKTFSPAHTITSRPLLQLYRDDIDFRRFSQHIIDWKRYVNATNSRIAFDCTKEEFGLINYNRVCLCILLNCGWRFFRDAWGPSVHQAFSDSPTRIAKTQSS